MPGLAHATTALHVLAGSIVLVVAPAALLVRKGGRWHRRWGVAFAAAMAFVLATAAFMWQPQGHVFLLVLDVVCAYLVFAGFRVILRRKRARGDGRADTVDVVAAALVLASSIALFVIAARASTPLMHTLAPILVALGVISAAFSALDLRAILTRVQTPLGSLLVHISAMLAAYISAVTAFCVINAHGVPMTLRWALPSALGTLVITFFSVQHRLRAARTSTRDLPNDRRGRFNDSRAIDGENFRNLRKHEFTLVPNPNDLPAGVVETPPTDS
jgi:hypothetical protein